jgi:IS5 family transposase
MYTNNTALGGRPNTDEVLMVKLLVLQQWYGLSDIELERQAAYRLDIQNFLGWPERPPDYSTVWQFRERLASTMTDAVLWSELQRQFNEAGLKVRRGVARTRPLSRRTPDHPTSLVGKRRLLGGAAAVTVRRDRRGRCLGTSCT